MFRIIFAFTVLLIGISSFAEYKPMSVTTYKAERARILKSIRAELTPETKVMTLSQQEKLSQLQALDLRFEKEQKSLANLYTSLFNKIEKACHRDNTNLDDLNKPATSECINVYNNLDRNTKSLVSSKDLYEAYSRRSLSNK
ncbi:MAG: hypothetical protein AABZ31_03360 [Bdellovibrionota bacterium]